LGRTEYLNDPTAPKANSLIPTSNLLVVNKPGAILLQRRRDTGQWAFPGGAQDIGESAAQCAVTPRGSWPTSPPNPRTRSACVEPATTGRPSGPSPPGRLEGPRPTS